MCHHCGFKPFHCCETAPGGWIPSGRAGSPWNRGCRQGLGCRKQQRDPRQGSSQSPMVNLTPQAPIPLLQDGGHSEPLTPLGAPSPVTGGCVPHCHWF